MSETKSSQDHDNSCDPGTYGELTQAGVRVLAARFNLSASSPTPSFYDMGSGTGKIVLHMVVFLHVRT